MEVWLHAFAFPGRTAELARRAEAWGYDGMLVADSQNLNADVWVELALAVAATERLRLGPGVTNTATRHPAVTASAAATLQAESGGRAVLGLGRGDSALAQIGRQPVAVAEFEAQLARIAGLLRGEEVELDDGSPSTIRWIAESPTPAVPVAVAASGPQVIAAGARHAQRLDFTVGAEPDRLRWAIGLAREAAGEGEPPSLGVFLDVAVDPDRARARDLIRGSTSILARFGAEGAPPEGLSEVTREGIARLAAEFDEARHGESGTAAARELADEFIDRFAVCGPGPEVAGRLAALAELGIERVIVVPGSLDADPAALDESNQRFAAEVLPALKPF